METISECIRKYVEAHDNEVTPCEVVNYILEEKKFEITEQCIRNKLTSVLKEVGGKLKPSPRYVGLIQEEIMKYLKNNNCVTYDEVVDYILKEKRINIIGRKIRNTLCMIVRKSGGEYSICSKKNNCNK